MFVQKGDYSTIRIPNYRIITLPPITIGMYSANIAKLYSLVLERSVYREFQVQNKKLN